jgi:hypothetical protein
VSFVAITLCVASQRVFIVVVHFVITHSENFRIHFRIPRPNRLRGSAKSLSERVSILCRGLECVLCFIAEVQCVYESP